MFERDFQREVVSLVPRLRRFALTLTHEAARADDLVQDTVERALRKRFLFKQPDNLCAWLMTLMHRQFLNEARYQRRHPAEEMVAAQAEASHDTATMQHLRMDIQAGLQQLDETHRVVLMLVAVEQFTYREVADLLEIPMGTVMSRLARARVLMQAFLEGSPPRSNDNKVVPLHTVARQPSRL